MRTHTQSKSNSYYAGKERLDAAGEQVKHGTGSATNRLSSL